MLYLSLGVVLCFDGSYIFFFNPKNFIIPYLPEFLASKLSGAPAHTFHYRTYVVVAMSLA